MGGEWREDSEAVNESFWEAPDVEIEAGQDFTLTLAWAYIITFAFLAWAYIITFAFQNPKSCPASISTPGASQKLSLTASESSRHSPPA